MKQIFTLTKVQLGSALQFLKIFSKGKREKKSASAAIILFGAVVLFGFLSATYNYMYGMAFQSAGMLSMLPGLMMAVVCIFTLGTTIYKVKDILFGSKDFDILMSLPVSASAIVASRILVLYIINFFFVLIVMIPNMAVYGYLAHPPIMFYVYSIIALFFMPLIPMIVASVVGVLLSAFSSRFRYSNLLNLILMIGLICGIVAFSFTMQSEQQMVSAAGGMFEQINSIYPLSELYLESVIGMKAMSSIWFAVISGGAFLLFCLIVGTFFIKLNTIISGKSTRKNYKLKAQTVSTPFKALYFKELKRLFSSVMYTMNGCIGVVIMAIGAIIIAVVQPKQITDMLQYPEVANMFKACLPFALALLAGMSYTSACSISLEGRNFWIIKSSPVPEKTVFLAKIAVNLTVTVPLLWISAILLGIFLKLSVLEWIMAFVIPTLFAIFTATGGLLINLKFPNLDWTNETIAIKQSASSMIATFGGMIFGGIPIFLFFQLDLPETLFQIGFTVIIIILDFLLWIVLNSWGKRQFNRL